MLAQLNKKLWDWLTVWNVFLAKMERDAALQRNEHRLLIFFRGYSLAHVIRPLVVARVLRQRGYEVIFAGRGPHAQRIAAEGFSQNRDPKLRMIELWRAGIWPDPLIPAELVLRDLLHFHERYGQVSPDEMNEIEALLAAASRPGGLKIEVPSPFVFHR